MMILLAAVFLVVGIIRNDVTAFYVAVACWLVWLGEKAAVSHWERKQTKKDPDVLICPECGSAQFWGGPEGGMSQMMCCAGCGREYTRTLGMLEGPHDASYERILQVYGPQAAALAKPRLDAEREVELWITGNNAGGQPEG